MPAKSNLQARRNGVNEIDLRQLNSDSEESVFFDIDNSDPKFENSSDQNTQPTLSKSEKNGGNFFKG